MKKIITFLFFITNHSLFAQVNLVPNPSFEDTVSCPYTGGEVDKAVGWHASRNTPDYFNQCNWINGISAVPGNWAGYQYAHSGVAYCGVISYVHNDPNYREDFTCQLINSLVVGKKYNVAFYVSWAGKLRMANNKLGILFSKSDYNNIVNAPIGNYSQVYTDSIITDSVNWTLIQKKFIADSNYSYLSIGNFFDSSFVDTIYPFPSSTAYYYFDDISVTEDTTSSISENSLINHLKIYPNPFSNELFIEETKDIVADIEIFDINNKLIIKSKIEYQTRSKLSTTQLKSGIYFLKINFRNNTSSNQKLIKL